MEQVSEPLSSSASEDSSSKPRQVETNQNAGAEKKSIITWLKSFVQRQSGTEASLRDELEEVLQDHEESGGQISEENAIIKNVLNFSEVKVSDVMTPRLDIRAISHDMALPEIISFILENEHTRLPVYRENMDDVIGFLHIKDLLKYWGDGAEFKVADVLRAIIFVPPSMKIGKLLERMKRERTHMAMVVDEYGGTDGLVTIEDLMEEIVGDIEDEHDDEEEELLRAVAEGVFEVSARIEIEELEEHLGATLRGEDEDFDTVGGYIFTRMGKVPEVGESYESEQDWKFEIISADNRKVDLVKVSRVEKQ